MSFLALTATRLLVAIRSLLVQLRQILSTAKASLNKHVITYITTELTTKTTIVGYKNKHDSSST